MPHYCGINLHSNNHVVVVIDESVSEQTLYNGAINYVMRGHPCLQIHLILKNGADKTSWLYKRRC